MATELRCSFCAKSEREVRKLVAGAAGGHICDECVSIAAQIIREPRTPFGAWHRIVALVQRIFGARNRSNRAALQVPTA